MLQAEVGQGYITQAEADAAKNEPLPTWLPTGTAPAEQPPRLRSARPPARRSSASGSTPKERRNTLLKGGLTITTTFDKNLQNMADDATRNALPSSPSGPDWGSSLVAIDPSTGAVKAMSQTADFADSQYNIGTHPVGRQPGSTWKVITLATALANGYSPNDTSTGNDAVQRAEVLRQRHHHQLGRRRGRVQRLSGRRPPDSVNCAFVRLSTSVGQDKVMEMAHKMGITQQRLFPHLTLSIGDIEATPLEMATVIATIANGGVHQTPYFVSDSQGP